MKQKTLLSLCLCLATGFVFSTPILADQAIGAARVDSIDGSGVTAQIFFLDSGSPENGLVVVGSATGLDPTQGFVTLIYDTGSVPTGPAACVPTGLLNGSQMFVGPWLIDEDGNGTLFAEKTEGSYVALGEIGTTSVRNVNFSLQACGAVEERGSARIIEGAGGTLQRRR